MVGIVTAECLTVSSRLLRLRLSVVPVRYRPNAASGRWSYGRDLRHCREKGNTRFDIISLRQLGAGICMVIVL